ncbi:DUF3761 domain-containing protein [Enterobacteriaceae bacterium Kacie_13]|nr:DUF3761 domain-containing protein [Enterobacteriaceae bacterium Kacie_13]
MLFCSGTFIQHGSRKTAHPSLPQDNELIEQGDYINSDGQDVHSPSHTRSGNAPDGASAKCRDGTYSFSQHHRGTCSRHGGVAEWLN